MEETKVHHGVTVVDDSGSTQPPPAYGPSPQGYYPPPTQGVTVVQPGVVSVAPIIMVQQMGPNPARVTCKSCHSEVVTTIEVKASTRTHLFAALLCVLGCWCCCCIPYCVDSCMSKNHHCPNCNAFIGTYKS